MTFFPFQKPARERLTAPPAQGEKMLILFTIILSILHLVSLASAVLLGFSWGYIAFALFFSYTIFSFGTLTPKEIGLLLFLGKPIRSLGAGLYFAPAFLFTVWKEIGTLFQDELPANPEKIFRGEPKEKTPEGMFPPIRILFGPPDPGEPEMNERLKGPYHSAMVAEATPVVSWRIYDPIKFFTMLGDVNNCRQHLTDKTVEVFNNNFSKMTPARALLKLEEIGKELQATLRKEAEENQWGILVKDAYVKPFGFSKHLNEAVIAVKVADQNAEAAKKDAEGKGSAIERLAEAERKRLLKTGLAKKTGDEEIELQPTAADRVWSQAISDLKDVKGTVVLDPSKVILGIKQGGDQ